MGAEDVGTGFSTAAARELGIKARAHARFISLLQISMADAYS